MKMKYPSQNKNRQLTLDIFRSSLDSLDKSNRWVILGDTLPWAELEKVYNSKLHNKDKGAGNKPARMIIAAMIIKHKMNLSDEETIKIIQENPYMQYMCGLSELTDQPIFDPSLFVTVRKRITDEEINEMTVRLLEEQRRRKAEAEQRRNNDDKGGAGPKDGDDTTKEEVKADRVEDDSFAKEFTDSKDRRNKGVLKMDATCANAGVRIDHHSWDAYNESSDLELHIRLFKQHFGCIPATILADKIYMNRNNREYLKINEIKTYSKPLGRSPKEPKPSEYYDNMAKVIGDRNDVESSFGTGKRIYRADNIRAKLPNTAECWTGMCYFIKNMMKFLRELCLCLLEKFDFWLHIIILEQGQRVKILY